MPYRGWTWPQFLFYSDRTRRGVGRLIATMAQGLVGGVSAILDKDAGKEFAQWLREVRK